MKQLFEKEIKQLKRCEKCGEIIISDYGCSCNIDEEMAEIIHDEIVNHD